MDRDTARIRVAALMRYARAGASSRVRMLQFMSELERQGIDVIPLPLFDDDYIRRLYDGSGRRPIAVAAAYARRIAQAVSARRFDVVWLEKELLPFVPAFAEFALLRGMRYVVDYDDAVFHNYDLHRSRFVRRVLGRKINRLMHAAAAVTAGNDYLAQRARASGARIVEILPSVVDMTRYVVSDVERPTGFDSRAAEDRAAAISRSHKDHEPLTIGWIGSPATEHYLALVTAPLAQTAAACGARIVVLGGTKPPVAPPAGEVWLWTEDDEAEAIARFDVGIMPLTDDPWSRGKCGYKLIQYMAAGKPVVASAVGANREIVRHGVNGFLASTDDEWRTALETLCTDPALRSRMGAAGEQLVREKYSIAVVAPRLAALLKSVAAGGAS